MTGTAIATKKKKPAASRAARHTKQYMRKGVDVSSYEAVLNKANDAAEQMPVEDLFVVDREPTAPGDMKKYTKRQQAKMDKITKLKVNRDGNEDDSLPAPKAPPRHELKRLRQPQPRPVAAVSKKPKTSGTYDLWDADFVPKIDLGYKAAGEHILRDTKKKLPQKPSRRLKPSLLRAVALPAPGISYNPTAEDYQEYVGKIAAEEQNYIDATERVAKQLKPKHEKIVTEEERELEQMEGLSVHPSFGKDDQETEEVAGETVPTAVSNERKTKKERAKEVKIKKEEQQKLKKKAQKLNENEVFKAKKIIKKLAKDEVDQAKVAADRQLKKLSEKMTKRQKLGRGKFEEEEAPFLLQEELTDSLRGLKAQGNLLTDRIKSMQKRNMLPIGGERQKAKKTKLRKKFVEKRTVQEVKKGSRII